MEQNTADYRIEMRVKNNRILEYMAEMGYDSVAAMCRVHPKLALNCVGELIRFKRSPLLENGDWSEIALNLAEALVVHPTELWTEQQAQLNLISNKRIARINEEEMALLMHEQPRPEVLLLEMQKGETIEKILQTVTPREEKVLRMRFGFKPYTDSMTLAEVAEEMDLTKERIRQIEAKVLRKLRNPSRTKHLKEFVCGEDYDGYEILVKKSKVKAHNLFFEYLAILKTQDK
jgi:RNA polymerase sigma factor (sigma-70 family)